MALWKSLKLSEAQFSHLSNGNNAIPYCYGKYQVQNKLKVLGYYEKKRCGIKKKSLDRSFCYLTYISRQTAFRANLVYQGL